jgi:hypothetical protein
VAALAAAMSVEAAAKRLAVEAAAWVGKMLIQELVVSLLEANQRVASRAMEDHRNRDSQILTNKTRRSLQLATNRSQNMNRSPTEIETLATVAKRDKPVHRKTWNKDLKRTCHQVHRTNRVAQLIQEWARVHSSILALEEVQTSNRCMIWVRINQDWVTRRLGQWHRTRTLVMDLAHKVLASNNLKVL